mmetsp:Transcript_17243/g.21173  ORF Transcript_17243/g.21173 Transcript_17243/m.21173 type:complete len:1691 (+) Transcript_17243:685-5757(+)
MRAVPVEKAIVEQVEQVRRARLVAEVGSAPKNNSMDLQQQQQQLQTFTAPSQLPPSHDAFSSTLPPVAAATNDVQMLDAGNGFEDDDSANLKIALQMSLEGQQQQQPPPPSQQQLNQSQLFSLEPTHLNSLSEAVVVEPISDEECLSLLQTKIFDLVLKEAIKVTFFQLNHDADEIDASATVNTTLNASDVILAPPCSSKSANHILNLLLHVVAQSETEEIRAEREEKVAKTAISKLSDLVDNCLELSSREEAKKLNSKMFHVSIILIMKMLLNLLLRWDPFVNKERVVPSIEPEQDVAEAETAQPSSCITKSKDKTDPRFVCETHGVPAVRRRCSHGIHKDRRFYVCGMERRVRCKYFKWADEDDGGFSHKDEGSGAASTDANSSGFPSRSGSNNKSISSSDATLLRRGACALEPNPVLHAQLWNLISISDDTLSSSNDSNPLQARICDLLQQVFTDCEEGAAALPSSHTLSTKKSSSSDSAEKSTSQAASWDRSLHNSDTLLEDYLDEVDCSKKKLGPSVAIRISVPQSSPISTVAPKAIVDVGPTLIQSSLDFLTHLASNSLNKDQQGGRRAAAAAMKENWSSYWFSLLCEILSSTSSSFSLQRSQAKQMLKRLCGGRKTHYHRVRDHYVFAFQFRKLIQHSSGPLQAAIIVRERANRCGNHWERGEGKNWSTLKSGELLGMDGLISEDCLTADEEARLHGVLVELSEKTKTRGGNWRQFCALNELPHAHSSKSRFAKHNTNRAKFAFDEESIHQRPPIFTLFWMACCISGSNQVIILRLMEIALSQSEIIRLDNNNPACDASESKGLSDGCILSTDGGNTEGNTDVEFSAEKTLPSPPGRTPGGEATPENALLVHHEGLTTNDIYSFIIQYVLRGYDVELRSAACAVTEMVIRNLMPSDLNHLFLRLVAAPLREVGQFGCASNEFFHLMQAIVREYGTGANKVLELSQVSNIYLSLFVGQTQAMRADSYGGAAEEAGLIEVGSDAETKIKKWYDLGSCIHCHRQNIISGDNNEKGGTIDVDRPTVFKSTIRAISKSSLPVLTPRVTGTSSQPNKSDGTSPETTEVSWLLGQVRPYTRNRLDALTERQVSSEFSLFAHLKYRIALSEVQLTISDPRGRLVKTVEVYFSPRQVTDINTLKSKAYDGRWQKCATLSLARGSSRSSCTLKIPVIASNLKFEYSEFHEKVGGSKLSDGSITLTCPRCTRVVSNAHGVCGHCGEVAFQCRKCRHINYDRLDAFLCVECGYCASGGFLFEVVAGIASNAVAITDEEDFSRAARLLRVATKRLCETRGALRKKLLGAAAAKRKRLSCGFEDLESMELVSPALKRAMLGELPRNKGSESIGLDSSNRNVVTSISSIHPSRRTDHSRLSTATKARSLLSLARQLRNESGSGISDDRPNRGDFLVRQAILNAGSLGGGGVELFDDGSVDDGDIFGDGIGGGGLLHGDMRDPLTRLVANIQARVRSSNAISIGSTGTDSNGDASKKSGRGRNADAGGDGHSNANDRTRLQPSPRAQLDECDRLYHQMREAERECHELQRTVHAWNRLNRDALASFSSSAPPANFVPTSCAACACQITLHYLVCAMGILRAGTFDIDYAVARDFVSALFEYNRSMTGELCNLKRLAIVTFAVNYEIGARLILKELGKRLRAVRDVESAEILGTLLEKKFGIVDEFVDLAVEVMHGKFHM